MRYKLEVRIPPADVGQRVTIRWRPPELEGSSKWMTDVLGILEEGDDQFFKVRRSRHLRGFTVIHGATSSALDVYGHRSCERVHLLASRCSPAAVISSRTRR